MSHFDRKFIDAFSNASSIDLTEAQKTHFSHDIHDCSKSNHNEKRPRQIKNTKQLDTLCKRSIVLILSTVRLMRTLLKNFQSNRVLLNGIQGTLTAIKRLIKIDTFNEITDNRI